MGSMLTVRKLADKTTGERLTRFDPETGAKKLVNPATPGDDHEPWPLAGVQIADPPDETTASTTFINAGVAEDWITLVGSRVHHAPGGPPADIWRVTHTFVEADRVVFHTVEGDLVYEVVSNPGKDFTQDLPTVRWYYELKRVG